jgi:hypothetical protein
MEHYEIQDVSNRVDSTEALVAIDVETRNAIQVFLVVANIGTTAARDVRFEFAPELPFRKDGTQPPIFSRGIKVLPVGRRYLIRYHTFPQILDKKSSIPESFDIKVSYLHGRDDVRVVEDYHIDLRDFEGTHEKPSEIQTLGADLTKAIRELQNTLREVSQAAQSLTTVAAGTGLQLSVTTLRNLLQTERSEARLEKLDPRNCDWRAFQEVLGISPDMAYRLDEYFNPLGERGELSEVEGMTEELLVNFREHFACENT